MTGFQRLRLAFKATSVLLAVSGCSSDRPATFPVSGTVVYRGAPLADAQVVFIPTAGQGRQSFGTTDAQGAFQLGAYEQHDGALPGKHQVTIVKMAPADPASESSYPVMKSVIPTAYGNPLTSTLEAEVKPSGENHFQFELVD